MSGELADQVALVTGAGRGIGRATAVHLAAAGCAVALIARTATEIESAAALAARQGVRTLALVADVTDDAQVEAAVRRARGELGRVSILINNAGWAPPRAAHAALATATWDRTLATCLRAPMFLCRLLLPDMLAQQRGAIINVASTAAHHARGGEAAYAAAKAGLLAFTHALFAEVRAAGIKVAAICPGYVDTAFIPPNRRIDRSKFLRADDVADAVLMLLTSAAQACPTELVLEPQFDPEGR